MKATACRTLWAHLGKPSHFRQQRQKGGGHRRRPRHGHRVSAGQDAAQHGRESVTSIIGFRNEDLILLEKEVGAVSDKLVVMTDDGSNGNKGFVTDALKAEIEAGEKFDVVVAIGPLIMMKFVSKLTKEYGIKTIVSMNPIMIDGTGMCGGCRVTVGGADQVRVRGRAGFRRPRGGFRRGDTPFRHV